MQFCKSKKWCICRRCGCPCAAGVRTVSHFAEQTSCAGGANTSESAIPCCTCCPFVSVCYMMVALLSIRLDGAVSWWSCWTNTERSCPWKFSGALSMIHWSIHTLQGKFLFTLAYVSMDNTCHVSFCLFFWVKLLFLSLFWSQIFSCAEYSPVNLYPSYFFGLSGSSL